MFILFTTTYHPLCHFLPLVSNVSDWFQLCAYGRGRFWIRYLVHTSTGNYEWKESEWKLDEWTPGFSEVNACRHRYRWHQRSGYKIKRARHHSEWLLHMSFNFVLYHQRHSQQRMDHTMYQREDCSMMLYLIWLDFTDKFYLDSSPSTLKVRDKESSEFWVFSALGWGRASFWSVELLQWFPKHLVRPASALPIIYWVWVRNRKNSPRSSQPSDTRILQTQCKTLKILILLYKTNDSLAWDTHLTWCTKIVDTVSHSARHRIVSDNRKLRPISVIG